MISPWSLLLLAVVALLPALRPARADQPGLDRLEAQLDDAAGRERLELLVELTTAYREERAERAVARGTEALELLRSIPDRAREVEALNSLAHAHIVLGNYQLSLQLALRAERLARVANDRRALAQASRNIGRTYRFTSDHQLALEYCGRAADLYRQIGDRPGLGDALNDTGIVHWMMGDHPAALDYLIRAHRMVEGSGDRRRIAGVLNNIGIVHGILDQDAEALGFYRRALELRQQVGPSGSVANVLNNIGNVYLKLGDPARALEYYLESLATGPADKEGESNTTMNVGRAHQDLGDLDRALELYQQAKQLKEDTGNRRGIARALLTIAGVHRHRGELDPALATLRQALAIALEIGARDDVAEAYSSLSEIYADLGRFEEALEAFKRHEQIEDEIFNEESSRNLARMQARFEADQKQKEIDDLRQQQALDALELKRQGTTRQALLGGLLLLSLILLLLYNRYRLRLGTSRVIEAKNAELERAMSALEAKNVELERFTYTVSHDLKSPLVTILGFLGFLERHVAVAAMDPGAAERVAGDVGRIRGAAGKMHQLIDGLLELSRVGLMARAPEDVALGELAREVRELLAGEIAERGAEVVIAPDLPVIRGDRIRWQQVLQNLMQNALQYMGDQPAPRIEVATRPAADGRLGVLLVRDNGAGIAPEDCDRVFGLFERLEPATSKGTGIGLALVQRIAEVHGGRVWVESEGRGRGSTFCVTLPPAAIRSP